MAPYVDGFVLAIKKDKLDAYKQMASLGGKIWMKHGALAYYECVGEDMTPPQMEMPEDHPDMGKMMTFPEMLKTSVEEVPVFSFIIFKSREHRDEVNAKVMADPEMSPEQYKDMEMPMDMNRMAYGGFQSFVNHQV
ncbi:DUF1428 domain-containing protein [Candidatus Peregrinibacteria bacterium]|nr:MAG: DUF1428 domain-containing protein [Candidatus Peregrinibacteria bacterium]